MFGAMQGSNREKMYFESAVDLFFSYVAGFSNILYLGFGLVALSVHFGKFLLFSDSLRLPLRCYSVMGPR